MRVLPLLGGESEKIEKEIGSKQHWDRPIKIDQIFYQGGFDHKLERYLDRGQRGTDNDQYVPESIQSQGIPVLLWE